VIGVVFEQRRENPLGKDLSLNPVSK
jgi:hypothetical protein